MESEKSRKDLANLVTDTLCICNDKYRDPSSGLTPDFMLSFRLNREGFSKGFYLPILNHLGFDSFDYFTYGGGAVVLPWTHEDTYRYLLGLSEDSELPKDLKLNQVGKWKSCIGGIRAGQVLFTRNSEEDTSCLGTLSGGTRAGKDVVKSKMKRPWQVRLPEHDLTDCPLCNKPQKNEETHGDVKVFDNSNTPYNWHKLIVPTKGFYQASVYDDLFLYAPERFERVLGLCEEVLSHSSLDNTKLGLHKGYSAGQNIAHLHFHLVG